MTSPEHFQLLPRGRLELIAYIATALVTLAYFAGLPLNPAHYSEQAMGVFFGADTWRVMESLANAPDADNYRDRVHPFFSLVAVSVARVGSLLGSGTSWNFLVYRMAFGTAGAFLFWLVVLRRSSMLCAYVALALLLSTPTARVWSSLPETFIFGFFTLMLALVIACRGGDVRAVLLVSMAGTITNAAVGFQYFLQRRRELARPLRALVDTLLVGAAIAVLQVALYPTSGLFFDLFGMREERRYIGISLHSVLFRPFDFLFSGFVLPLPPYQGELTSELLWRNSLVWPTARPEILRAVAVLSALLLLAGAYVVAAWRFATGDRVWIDKLVAGFLVFELALHTVYGDTPFLYSFHFVPFLILFLAFQLPRSFAAVWMLLITVAVQASCDWHRFLQVFG